VLMTGSVLLLKALIRLRGADLGFNPENVATATINLPRAGYPGPAAQKAFAAELVRRIRSQPGMDAAAIADAVPGGAGQGFLYFGIPGRSFDAGQQPGSQLRAATADYFAVLEIALISGRVFQASDREEAAPVVIIDEPLARRYFPGDNALGKFVLVGGDTVPKEIVGIVRGVRHNGPDGVDQPVMYIPLAQARLRTGQMSILVRAADVAAAGRVVREQLRALGSGVPIYNEQTLAERVAQSMGPVRIVTSLSVIFGICAAFLACIGVYGVLSFAVAQRTREMGVRLALGAPPGRVVLGVAGNGMAVVGVGVLVGLGLSWWATRALAALLTSVRPGDVTSFVFASALFLIIAAVASIIPAARAGRVDPLTALRAD